MQSTIGHAQPTVRQLEAFVAIADELHFGRAAARLGLSQPTVSQEIGRLERVWGVALFDRSSRSVALTSSGRELLVPSRAVLDQLSIADDLALACRREHRDTVRMVVSPSVADVLLPAVLRDVDRLVPGLQVAEELAESGQVVDRMRETHADLAVGRFLTAIPGMRRELLCDEPLYAVLGRAHPAAAGQSVRLSDLQNLPLLLWPREQAPRYYDRLLELCGQRGLSPLLLVNPAHIAGPRLYLLSGLRAFALMPRSATRVLPAELAALPLSKPATLPLEMLWRLRDPRPWFEPVLGLVRQHAVELAMPEPWG
jgi:DNA-binding transcriptional LysR family regulator